MHRVRTPAGELALLHCIALSRPPMYHLSTCDAAGFLFPISPPSSLLVSLPPRLISSSSSFSATSVSQPGPSLRREVSHSPRRVAARASTCREYPRRECRATRVERFSGTSRPRGKRRRKRERKRDACARCSYARSAATRTGYRFGPTCTCERPRAKSPRQTLV